jgi:hypothetical protein
MAKKDANNRVLAEEIIQSLVFFCNYHEFGFEKRKNALAL